MALRTDEYYLDVLCEIGPEEILKFTQFKVGTRHKLSSAVKQYKSMHFSLTHSACLFFSHSFCLSQYLLLGNMNTMQQPTKNSSTAARQDERMDNFLRELKSGKESFLVIEQNQIEYQEMLGKGGAGTVWKVGSFFFISYVVTRRVNILLLFFFSLIFFFLVMLFRAC